MIDKDRIILKSTASGFGKYVYCGRKWLLDNDSSLDWFRKGKHDSYDESQKTKSLKIGQQNEYRCIKWLMTRLHKTGSVLFDGTGQANYQSFTTKMHTFKTTLQCRPDLIVKHEDQTILYEFKAVGKCHYRLMPEFDSSHAQVWCYRSIKDFKIDKYYLFRYYEDPFNFDAFPNIKELKSIELSDEKFIPHFEQYIDAIKVLNRIKTAPNRSYSNNIIAKLYKPINAPDKCFNCIYNVDKICKPKFRPR